jgi:Flp pilus assembly protein TadD
MVWPKDLAVFYPYPNTGANQLATWWVAGSVALLIVLSVIALRSLRRRPYVFVGWAWYVITLVPVIGLVQVGTQSIADRYTYVPLIGIFVALVWWVASLAAARPALKWGVTALASAVILACAVTAHAQAGYWQSNWTLWNHALDVTTANYMADNEVGVELVKQGKHDEALPHFEQAARERPEYVEAHNNLGLAYTRVARLDEAIEQFTLATRLKPDRAETFNDLGFALLGKGRSEDAISNYRTALRLKPDFVEAHNNLGFALAAAGRVNEAIPHFQEAARLAPTVTTAHMYLGMAYGAAGNLADSVREFKEVVRLDPAEKYAQEQVDKIEAEIKRRGGR